MVRPSVLALASLWLALSNTAAALSPQPPPTVVDIESPMRVRVDAGAATEWSFTITNLLDVPLSGARIGGWMATSQEALAGYTFVPLAAACGAPRMEHLNRFAFPVSGPIAAGESLRCAYRIERAADAAHDLRVQLCSTGHSYCDRPLAIGTLPEMRIRIEQVRPVAFGADTALVRLHVDNLSDWVIPRRDVTTTCEEFRGGQAPPRPFLISTSIDGGCEAGQSQTCLNFGGQNYFSYGFRLGPFAAGESRSCLLQLQFHSGAANGLATSVYFSDFRVLSEDGDIGVGSIGTYEGVQPLGVRVTPPANAAPVQVPTGRLGGWLMAAAILGSALALIRLRSR